MPKNYISEHHSLMANLGGGHIDKWHKANGKADNMIWVSFPICMITLKRYTLSNNIIQLGNLS